jgi:RNA polymerase sigma-70 factor (ECF subfamily)
MSGAALDRVFREASGRIVGALAARFRDLSLAEDACAEACTRALEQWPATSVPDDPAAWLYRVAYRVALDATRRRNTHRRFASVLREDDGGAYDPERDDGAVIPDERLRLIFICCHPAVSVDARAALTLRLVCGLSTQEIARAFLVPEVTLAQRLTRAKQKIADARVPFEVPGPEHWSERLEAVLSTLEVAYAKAHEDAAGTGVHAHYAAEMLVLSQSVAQLMPHEPEALATAATILFAEARRPARIDAKGEMVPLSEQDPGAWDRVLIDIGAQYLEQAARLDASRPRVIQARIHGCWCSRRSLAERPPWDEVVALYDQWLAMRDSPVARLNRAVALAETDSPAIALIEVNQLDAEQFADYAPFHAVRADLLRRTGRCAEARSAYDKAIALVTTPAERAWLTVRRDRLDS